MLELQYATMSPLATDFFTTVGVISVAAVAYVPVYEYGKNARYRELEENWLQPSRWRRLVRNTFWTLLLVGWIVSDSFHLPLLEFWWYSGVAIWSLYFGFRVVWVNNWERQEREKQEGRKSDQSTAMIFGTYVYVIAMIWIGSCYALGNMIDLFRNR